MELTQLKYFVAAAKMEHISKAADELHIAQPSLSQVIKRLENELETKLFIHQGRNIVLTDTGRYLLEKGEKILEITEKIPSDIAEIQHKNKYTISLNVTAASLAIVEALIDYREKNSHINFHIVQNDNEENCDIAVFTEKFYQKKSDLPTRIFTESIYLAVPSQSDTANCDEISLEDVKNRKFISLAGSKRLRSICDNFCMNAGFLPKIIFESDSPDAVRKMISANLGIGFWPAFTWGNLGTDSVKLIKIKSPICQRDIILQLRTNEKHGNYKEAEKFYLFLNDYFESKIFDFT